MTWIEHVSDIIQAAAQSSLGLIALVVIVLTFIAYVFFKDTGVKVRLTIFFALLLGAATFIGAIIIEWDSIKSSSTSQTNGTLLRNINTGWVFVGIYDFQKKAWKGKKYVDLLNQPDSELLGQPNFTYGDTVVVRHQERNVIIMDYKIKGLTKQDTCPAKDKIEPSDVVKLKNEDYTGIILPIDYELEVREICFGIIPDKPDQAVWLKVADN